MKTHLRILVVGLVACGLGVSASGCTPSEPQTFSGPNAYSLAEQFLNFGPRVSGTDANQKAGDWIETQLKKAGWDTFLDKGTYRNTAVRNIAGKRGQGPVIILGAHYDSRRCADQPQGGCTEPVLGANDGASGVAVLLELARTLELDWSTHQIWLVFFDAEDNGRLDGWDWIVGSRQFAVRVQDARTSGTEFQAMILLDMVADSDQQFYFEGNSDPSLRGQIWAIASAQGYEENFIPSVKFTMIDDHIPFRDLGIPVVDIIDFDYPDWHTTGDTLDKISAMSLERVGRTVEAWLENSIEEAPEEWK